MLFFEKSLDLIMVLNILNIVLSIVSSITN